MKPHPESGPASLALLAHELRTPLTALLGYAQAMKTEVFGPINPPYGEHAAIIHQAASHLLALVDDMTDIAHAEAGVWAGTPTRFELHDAVEEAVGLMTDRALRLGATIRLAVDGEIGSILGDRRAVRQLVFNLLDNALKHAGGGGEIVVTLTRSTDEITLSVADRGVAGAPSSVPRGEGLGLRLVRAICATHGGSFELKITGDAGATATARLRSAPAS